MEAIQDLRTGDFFVRIRKIEFIDFRNIERGTVVFPDSSINDFHEGKPSILGLYGQNGSGKSSVVMALGILKSVLSGNSLSDRFSSCVRSGCEKCTLKFDFSAYFRYVDLKGNELLPDDHLLLDVSYSFDVARGDDKDADEEVDRAVRLFVVNEVLKIKGLRKDGSVFLNKQVFFDTSLDACENGIRAFGGKQKYELFTLYDAETQRKCMDIKAVAKSSSKSFLFCKDFIDLIGSAWNEVVEFASEDEVSKDYFNQVAKAINSDDAPQTFKQQLLNAVSELNEDLSVVIGTTSLFMLPYIVLKNFRMYASKYLHVLDTSTMGLTSINDVFPLMLWHRKERQPVTSLRIDLRMNEVSEIPAKDYPDMKMAFNGVRDALTELVPGLVLKTRELGKRITEKNIEMQCFDIISCRNGIEIPLKYESDGIRRLVSIMSLLIAAYNEETFTIAIDEIDTGLFEYLLGELLTVMSESIKGQLIFTSHNLRPLEVLPAKYLCFTTTDAKNRFVTLSKRGNSNLRDCYFRSIVLGNDKADLYRSTDRYNIEIAMRKAGENNHD